MEWWEPWPRRLVKMDPDQWARLAADQPPEGALALCAAAHEMKALVLVPPESEAGPCGE